MCIITDGVYTACTGTTCMLNVPTSRILSVSQ